MSDVQSLDQVLLGDMPTEPTTPEPPTGQPAPQAPPVEPKPADSAPPASKGDISPAGAKPGEGPPEGTPPPTPSGDDHMVPVKALREERKKRQEAEQQIAYFRGQADARSQSGASQPGQQPTREEVEQQYYEDPVGFTQKLVSQERSKVESEQWGRHVDLCRQRMLSQHEDYETQEAAFIDAANTAQQRGDSALIGQMRNAPDPAEFVYNWGKNYKMAEQYGGDLGKMVENIRVEERAKLETEFKQQGALQTAAGIPKTQAGARGTGADTAPAQIEDIPLNKIGWLDNPIK